MVVIAHELSLWHMYKRKTTANKTKTTNIDCGDIRKNPKRLDLIDLSQSPACPRIMSKK